MKCSQCDGEGNWMEPAPVGVIPCPSCGGTGSNQRLSAALGRIAELEAENARLRQQISGHCERIAMQSEALSRAAERGPV